MKALGSLFLGVVLVAGTLADAPGAVNEVVFVPPVYFVGDLVEARLTLVLPEGKTLLPPLSLPSQDWVLFRDVQVRHDPPFERVTLKFIPFAPGVKNLPPLVLGDITLEGVRISTSSLLGKATPTELRPPREQMLLQHTELFLFLAFLLLIVLPLTVWRLFRPVSRLAQSWWARSSRRRAWKALNRDLKRLQAKALALKGPEFYTQFNHLVRMYLGARFDRDFQTLTASEVRGLLQPLPPAWTAEWVRLLHRADVVRFDAQEPPEQEKLDDLESLRRESAKLEGKEGPRVDL